VVFRKYEVGVGVHRKFNLNIKRICEQRIEQKKTPRRGRKGCTMFITPPG
jgi:hypothetical protein